MNSVLSRWLVPSLLALSLAVSAVGCEGGSNNGASGGGAGGGGESKALDIGETLATVNGLPVGSKEFQEAAMRKTPAAGDTLSPEEKKEVLDRLVEEKLLYQAALKKGLDRDPKVQKVMVNTLLREDVYANVKNSDFNDEQLQAYYEAHKEEFVVPEKVQIKRILIKVTAERPDEAAKAEAERIKAELGKNKDAFKDLAAKHSEDPYRRRGGDVGFVAKTGKPGLDQAVVDKAFTLTVDEISEVFKTSEGYNIVSVANKRERVERTFQQMKGSVLRKVKNDKLKELYDKYVADLKATAKVDVQQAKVDAIEIKTPKRPAMMGAGDMPGHDDLEGMDEAPPSPGEAPGAPTEGPGQ